MNGLFHGYVGALDVHDSTTCRVCCAHDEIRKVRRSNRLRRFLTAARPWAAVAVGIVLLGVGNLVVELIAGGSR